MAKAKRERKEDENVMRSTVGMPQVGGGHIALRQAVSPALQRDEDDDSEVVRQNVLLRNGTTVNADDYDEDVHGPSIEESDDEYLARMRSYPTGREIGRATMPTTIPNLQTFDSTQVPDLTPPVVTTPPAVVAGQPVLTSDEPNSNLVDLRTTAPGRVVNVEEAKAIKEDQEAVRADMTNRAAERRSASQKPSARRAAKHGNGDSKKE
jgi:hypothetical protein